MLTSIATRILLPALCLAALVNCAGPTGEVPDPDEIIKSGQEKLNSPARLSLSLGKVGVLSKTSAISLRKLVLAAVSSGSPADTVRDTSALNGSEAVTVKRVLRLKPLLSWTVRARTLDQRDSTIHMGETQPFTVQPADTAEVSLSLASRYVMYQAMFSNLPNSISASQGNAKVGINLNRVVLKIDGVVKADSTLPANQYFMGGQNVALHFDYVTPGTHAVTLEAYGAMEKWSGLMFSGSASFTSTAGQDGSQPVTLKWVGPSTGAERLTIILGHIGKVTILGGFNPML